MIFSNIDLFLAIWFLLFRVFCLKNIPIFIKTRKSIDRWSNISTTVSVLPEHCPYEDKLKILAKIYSYATTEAFFLCTSLLLKPSSVGLWEQACYGKEGTAGGGQSLPFHICWHKQLSPDKYSIEVPYLEMSTLNIWEINLIICKISFSCECAVNARVRISVACTYHLVLSNY